MELRDQRARGFVFLRTGRTRYCRSVHVLSFPPRSEAYHGSFPLSLDVVAGPARPIDPVANQSGLSLLGIAHGPRCPWLKEPGVVLEDE